MSRYENASDDDVEKWVGAATKGASAGECMQTRFKLIPDAHLNKETIAGVRDMNLGRIKNGKPVGAATIRFDTGQNKGGNPHINIDPMGRPNANNPHIEVPPELIKGVEVVNKTLKYAGITLTVAAIAIDTWRIASAFKEDLHIRDNADKIIRELEVSLEKLRYALKNENNMNRRRDIRNTIEHLENVLRDVKRTKLVPVKTLKTTSSVAGGWGGGAVGGMSGAWAGTQAGALIGAPFGPVGVAVGAPIGALVGAIGGGVSGGLLGSAAGEAAADWGLQLADSKKI